MKWILLFCSLFLSFQPVQSEERYHPVITQPVCEAPRHQPFVVRMGTEALRFLKGSWAYSDEDVRIVESWAIDQFGDTIGIRKRMFVGPKAKSISEMYDFFTAHGNQMKMRRMDKNLLDVGTKTGIVGCGSDCSNKVSIVLNECIPAQTPVMEMNYVSPNDDELDLEITTTENGTQTKENYKLARVH